MGKPADFKCLQRFRYLLNDVLESVLECQNEYRFYEDFGYGRVAQLVEQVTFNHWVTGSNPVPLTIISR